MSKLGLHHQTYREWTHPDGWTDKPEFWAGHSQPVVASLVMNGVNPDQAHSIKLASPLTRVQARLGGYWNGPDLVRFFEQAGLDKGYDLIASGNEGDSGPEPVWDVMNNTAWRQILIDREVAGAAWLRSLGFRYVGTQTWSYGAVEQLLGWTGDGQLESAGREHVRQLRLVWEAVDYVAINSYGDAPEIGHRDRAFDYRQLHRWILEETGLYRPVFIQEFGTKEERLAWLVRERRLWETYLPWLRAKDAEFAKDSFLLGACLWTVGGLGEWEHHELTREGRFMSALADYLHDAPKSREWPEKEEPMADQNWQGIDVSIWAGTIPDAKWKAAAAEGVKAAIVQAFGRTGTNTYGKNPHCAHQLAGARMAGLKTAIYVNIPASNDVDATPVMEEAKAAAGRLGAHISFVALDVEGKGPLHPEDPAERLGSAAQWAWDQGYSVVIYTSPYMWKIVMPGVIAFQGLWLWDADYDKDPRLDAGFMPYGGWTKRYGKQHTPSVVGPGGIWCDLNTFDPELFEDVPDPPTIDWKVRYLELKGRADRAIGVLKAVTESLEG